MSMKSRFDIRKFHDMTLLICNRYIKYFQQSDKEHELLYKQLRSYSDLSSRKNFEGHITAGTIILNHTSTAFLTVHNKALDLWLLPGGHYEQGESISECALREVREETSLTSVYLHPWHSNRPFPFDLDTHSIPANPVKNEQPHFHHDFRYLACFKYNEKIALQYEEVSGVKWIRINDSHIPTHLVGIVQKLKSEFTLD